MGIIETLERRENPAGKIWCVLRNDDNTAIVFTRDAGHPWFGHNTHMQWDILEIICFDNDVLRQLVAKAEVKFWVVWIIGNLEGMNPTPFSAVLYKPAGATAPWQDLGPKYRKPS